MNTEVTEKTEDAERRKENKGVNKRSSAIKSLDADRCGSVQATSDRYAASA
jgi:hypothetical protein